MNKRHLTRMPTSALITAGVCFIASSNATAQSASDYLEELVPKMPRGSLNIPAQWFEMESLAGWEKMMLIFGYADNVTTCDALAELAKVESPGRNFRCVEAN